MNTGKELEALELRQWCITSWECSVWLDKGRKSKLS